MKYQTFNTPYMVGYGVLQPSTPNKVAKHTVSGRCDITPMVCCTFGGHSTPQFLQDY